MADGAGNNAGRAAAAAGNLAGGPLVPPIFHAPGQPQFGQLAALGAVPPLLMPPAGPPLVQGQGGEAVLAGAPDAAGAAVAAAAVAPLPAAAPPPPPAAAAEQREQDAANPRGAAIPANPVREGGGAAGGGGGFLGFLQYGLGVARGYAGQAMGWLSRESEVTVERILSANPVYRPSKLVRTIIAKRDNPQYMPYQQAAIAAQTAGEEVTAAARRVLTSLVMYRSAYAADGASNPRALLVATNRLFEDILLFLVADYKKSKTKTNLMDAVAENPGLFSKLLPPSRNANSNVEGRYAFFSFSTSIDLFPYQIRDILNAILRENPAKAAQYRIRSGDGVREHAGMPRLRIRGRGAAGNENVNENFIPANNNNAALPVNNVALLDADYLPAARLAQKILNARRARIEGALGSGAAALGLPPARLLGIEGAPPANGPRRGPPAGEARRLLNALAGNAEDPQYAEIQRRRLGLPAPGAAAEQARRRGVEANVAYRAAEAARANAGAGAGGLLAAAAAAPAALVNAAGDAAEAAAAAVGLAPAANNRGNRARAAANEELNNAGNGAAAAAAAPAVAPGGAGFLGVLGLAGAAPAPAGAAPAAVPPGRLAGSKRGAANMNPNAGQGREKRYEGAPPEGGGRRKRTQKKKAKKSKKTRKQRRGSRKH